MGEQDPELEAIFRGEARRRVRAMAEALRERRADALWRHAHTLKGAAGTVGHRRAEAIARDLLERLRDQRLREEDEPHVREGVRELVDEFG